MRWNDDDQINNWLLVIDLIFFFPEESDHHSHANAMQAAANETVTDNARKMRR
jgi:hypothetical protein